MSVVVLIVATLATVTVPRIADAVQRTRQDMSARTLASRLVAAREAAIAEYRSVDVVFEPGQNRYRVDANGQWFSNEPGVDFRVDFGGELSLSFDASGQPNHGGTILFAQQAVSVMPSTGEVRIGTLADIPTRLQSGGGSTTSYSTSTSSSSSDPESSSSSNSSSGNPWWKWW